MNAVILLGTLKKEGLSNTQTLCEFLQEKMSQQGVGCEIVKLVDYRIAAGTESSMGEGDEWPRVLDKILGTDIIVFATPVWWGSHSSEIQRVIERLDAIHDGILEGKKSPLEGKAGGIVATGDSDGAEHVIGNIANFMNAIGLVFPPYATLTVLWEGQRKGATTPRNELMKKYEQNYTSTAEIMVQNMVRYQQR